MCMWPCSYISAWLSVRQWCLECVSNNSIGCLLHSVLVQLLCCLSSSRDGAVVTGRVWRSVRVKHWLLTEQIKANMLAVKFLLHCVHHGGLCVTHRMALTLSDVYHLRYVHKAGSRMADVYTYMSIIYVNYTCFSSYFGMTAKCRLLTGRFTSFGSSVIVIEWQNQWPDWPSVHLKQEHPPLAVCCAQRTGRLRQ